MYYDKKYGSGQLDSFYLEINLGMLLYVCWRIPQGNYEIIND